MSLTVKTNVISARANTKSLRVTVPEPIVFFLNLRDKDKLAWTVESLGDEKVVVVRRVESP